MGGLTPSPSTGVVTAAEVWAYTTRVLTSSLDPTAAEIWASATRTLTDPDSYKADVSALALQTSVDEVESLLKNSTYGLSALETLVDEVESLLKNGTYGLSALDTDLNLLLARIGDPTDPTVDTTIKGYLLALQSMTETVGTSTMTGAEVAIYQTDRASLETYEIPFVLEGYLDLGTMAGGDTIVVKEYAQAADGTERLLNTSTYTGAQTESLVWFEQKIGGYDYRLTAQQTGGTNRTLPYIFERRRVR